MSSTVSSTAFPTTLLLFLTLITAPAVADDGMPDDGEPGDAVADAAKAHGLTAVPGLLVGHHTLGERPSGCTVIVAPGGAVAGVDVRGGAPGTREMALLDPVNMVQRVDAVVLSGGSAFGLDAATGAVRWLEEHGHGFDVGVAKVPIVPAAILFDLRVGDAKVRPDADCGYRAATAASAAPVAEGNVGAGAGATVGKLRGGDRAMKSGLGSEELRFDDGLVVAALAAVNAVGTVVDPVSGEAVAGVRSLDGTRVLPPREWLLEDATDQDMPLPVESTTLVVVATNAVLTKAQATKVAQMAHDGLARTIVPVHTPFDGDTVFALSTGTWRDGADGEVDVLRLGAAAAEAAERAILRAARQATGLPGLPAARDLSGPSDGPAETDGP